MRLTTTIVGRAGSPERVDDARAAPPAPSTHNASSGRRRRRRAGSEATKPSPSVLCAEQSSRRRRSTTVLTERSAAAAGSSSSTAAATSLLVRHRDREPADARASRIAVDGRRAASPGATSNATYHPVDAGGRERGVVQRRRQRCAAPAMPMTAASRRGTPGDHPSKPRSAGAAATLASCCSSVAANAWLPSSSAST